MSNLNHVELLLTAEEQIVSRKDLSIYPKMQMRVQMDQDTVAQYAEKIEAILEEKPIEVVAVDVNGYVTWYVVDGFHRYHAAVMAELENVKVKMMTGTYEQALQYAMSANWKNGLRPKKEDASRSISMLMETAPDFGFDSKQVIKWLSQFGIPKETARDNTKTLRESIDTKRDAKIVTLHADGLSLRQIAEVVGGSQVTIKNRLESVQNERDAQTEQDDSATAIPATEFVDESGAEDDESSPFFDESDLDTTPAINPADAFQKALNEHEATRQETQENRTQVAPNVVASENKTLEDVIKNLLREAGIYEDHTKAEVNAALFNISQGN